jgi:hypothetical protein
MTVKELIEKLKMFNEDYEVVGPCKDGFEWVQSEMCESDFTQNDNEKIMYISK